MKGFMNNNPTNFGLNNNNSNYMGNMNSSNNLMNPSNQNTQSSNSQQTQQQQQQMNNPYLMKRVSNAVTGNNLFGNLGGPGGNMSNEVNDLFDI